MGWINLQSLSLGAKIGWVFRSDHRSKDEYPCPLHSVGCSQMVLTIVKMLNALSLWTTENRMPVQTAHYTDPFWGAKVRLLRYLKTYPNRLIDGGENQGIVNKKWSEVWTLDPPFAFLVEGEWLFGSLSYMAQWNPVSFKISFIAAFNPRLFSPSFQI